MKLLYIVTGLFLFSSCNQGSSVQSSSTNAEPSWSLVDFVKMDSLNPILKPDSSQTFYCPVSRANVHWEERNVLNPAAVVKDGKVYLIYRAQDHAMTSRLGMAVSEDGLHFIKQPAPVLFPDNDAFKIYEWKGGVED